MDKVASDLKWARWAVARWAGFPVTQDPRPLVMVGLDQWSEGGFRSGDAKLAFIYGQTEADVVLPEAVLAALRSRPHRGPPPRSAGVPLVITAGHRCEAEFRTDRGRRVLHAWRLEADDANGPIWLLDPELAAQAWAPPHPAPSDGGSHRSIGATLHPDGRTLTFRFVGADPSFEEYPRAEVVESAQAVAVVPMARDIGSPGLRFFVGHRREVEVQLAQPLNTRVLVDLDGSAAEVIVA